MGVKLGFLTLPQPGRQDKGVHDMMWKRKFGSKTEKINGGWRTFQN
jgi:hypothetical protein